MSGVGGCATINGIIFINSNSGRVMRGLRKDGGKLEIRELVILSAAYRRYKSTIEVRISSIPVIREAFKVILMIIISVYSFFIGITEIFSLKNKWPVRKVILFPLACTLTYLIVAFDDITGILALAALAACFRTEMGELFKYHGAEHKVINLYESTSDIAYADLETAKKASRIHKRCGTNLIVMALPAAALLYMAELFMFPQIDVLGELILSTGIIIAALEILKFLQKGKESAVLRAGLLLQEYVTTKEPEDKQLELALKTLKGAVE